MDGVLERKLSEEAIRRKRSKNRLVKDILARGLGVRTEGGCSDDYREFCGLWTAEETGVFTRAQNDNARIDAGDWET